jgi:hypothetical protein
MTDKFRTVVYQSLTLKLGAQIALDHRLYIPGWQLSHTLQGLKISQDTHNRIAIGFLDDVAVAVATLDGTTVQAFCRKAQRRNGYGGQCVRALRATKMRSVVGIDGSDKFWEKMGADWNFH